MILQSFFPLIVIYFLATVLFYWGLVKYSNVRTVFGCILIVIGASALETAVEKGLGFIVNGFL